MCPQFIKYIYASYPGNIVINGKWFSPPGLKSCTAWLPAQPNTTNSPVECFPGETFRAQVHNPKNIPQLSPTQYPQRKISQSQQLPSNYQESHFPKQPVKVSCLRLEEQWASPMIRFQGSLGRAHTSISSVILPAPLCSISRYPTV